MGGWRGRVGSRRWAKPFIRTQTAVLCVQQVTERDSIHRTGQDSRWQQSGTSHILISATHWPHRPCIAPWWFDRVGKKPSVKAALVIFSYLLGIFMQCKSVGLIISYKLDFISCADRDGFRKSSHICYMYTLFTCSHVSVCYTT